MKELSTEEQGAMARYDKRMAKQYIKKAKDTVSLAIDYLTEAEAHDADVDTEAYDLEQIMNKLIDKKADYED